MKIFLSWSGARSRAVAEALNDWLKRVIQAVKPFYSSEIEKGAKWSSELDAALEGTRFGIICLTPDNLSSTWIHYEAGALSKTADALIWTFLHSLNPGDVPPPLGKFQHTVAQKDDVLRLLGSINRRLADVGGEPIDNAVLLENFELYWPKLEERLKEAETKGKSQTQAIVSVTTEKPRDEREILLEILEIVRNQHRVNMRVAKVSPSVTTRLTLFAPLGARLSSDISNRIISAIKAYMPDTRVNIDAETNRPKILLTFKNPISPEEIGDIIQAASDVAGVKLKFE